MSTQQPQTPTPGGRRRGLVHTRRPSTPTSYLRHRSSAFKKQQQQSLLHSLQRRKPKSKRPMSLDNTTVSTVIDNYIMPLFETEFTPQDRHYRTSLEGPVYSELKYTQRLNTENKHLHEEIDELKWELAAARQQAALMNDEYSTAQTELIQTQSHLKALQMQLVFGQDCAAVQPVPPPLPENSALWKQLDDERMAADRMKGQLQEARHLNSLLALQNLVIGEKLKGLYESFAGLTALFPQQNKLKLELDLLWQTLPSFFRELESFRRTSHKLSEENITFESAANSLRLSNHKMERVHEQSTAYFVKQVRSLTEHLEVCTREKERLSEELAELKDQNKALTSELAEANQKLKKFRVFQSADNAEQFCKNCKKSYFEAENYNWSCKTHKSPFSGSLYFCCGKSNKYATGCIQAKHEPRDDELEERTIDIVFCTVSTKQNCKELGHPAKKCDKDPNIRTNFYPLEEFSRVKCVLRARAKVTMQSLEANAAFRRLREAEVPEVSDRELEDLIEAVRNQQGDNGK